MPALDKSKVYVSGSALRSIISIPNLLLREFSKGYRRVSNLLHAAAGFFSRRQSAGR
jgi:hypothetical protein